MIKIKKMAEFQKLHPKVFFDFNTTTSDIIKDQMDKGLLDIGILLEPIETELINNFSGIKVLKLKPELTARTVVVWKKNIPMNTATTKFIEFLRE